MKNSLKGQPEINLLMLLDASAESFQEGKNGNAALQLMQRGCRCCTERRERRRIGNTPASQVNFHPCEQGAEALLSSPILQIQPTYKVMDADKNDLEMTFFPTRSCQRQACFCQGDANKASPDTDNRQKLPLLARTGNTAQTV